MPRAKIFSQAKKFPVQRRRSRFSGISSLSIGWCIMYVSISRCSRSSRLFITEAEHVCNGRPSIHHPTWLHQDDAAARYAGFTLNTTNIGWWRHTHLLCTCYCGGRAIGHGNNARRQLAVSAPCARSKTIFTWSQPQTFLRPGGEWPLLRRPPIKDGAEKFSKKINKEFLAVS